MRILILGAGATGGYFGGRLLQNGRDVTFLVHARRAAQLAQTGLHIASPCGDAQLADPPTMLAADLGSPFDLVVLSCKAYGLEQAMEDIAPAVGSNTLILPLLNGMCHLNLLDARFGAERVLGGRCMIAATLDEDGSVRHLNQTHGLTFGDRGNSASGCVQQATAALTGAGFDARASATIVQAMWDKWVFLASLAGITCLMRGSVGDIVAAPGGKATALALLDECLAVAAQAGYPLSEAGVQRAAKILTEPGSSLTASMLRDMLHGHAIEADHVIGDMLSRAGKTGKPLLAAVYARMKLYENSRTQG